MNNLKIIQTVIDYIEDNLLCEISADELATLAGFSTYHFYRIFADLMGMPIIQYITKRRLIHAIYAISNGEKIIDAALKFGFDTHGGFFKAFKREYGCSPRKYINNVNIPKPQRINLKKEMITMLSNKQVKELLSHWNLPKPLRISNTHVTILNLKSKNMWLINDKYILKSETNLSALKQNLTLSNALQKSGLKSACSIPLKNGDDFLLEGDTYYCLFPYLLEKTVDSEDLFRSDSLNYAHDIGEKIGDLHNVFKNLDTIIDCRDENLYSTTSNWAIPEVKKTLNIWDKPLPEEFFIDYINNFKNLYPQLPCHIIHKDSHPGNILVEDNELVGFTEFQLSERNVRLFDPCYCATGVLMGCIDDAEKSEKWINILNNILSGYNEICPLTKEEIDSILYVLYSIQLICIAYFSNHDEYKKLAEPNKKVLLFIYENREKIKSMVI